MKRLIAVPLLALMSMPLLAEDRPDGDETVPSNVLYTVTANDPSLGDARSSQSVRALGVEGERTRLMSGWRIPFPVRSLSPETTPGGQAPAVTSFQYQEIGFSASLEGHLVGRNRVRVGGFIELSSVSQDRVTTSSAPSVGTVTHRFGVLLNNGEETLLAEIPRPDGTVLTLTLAAEIQQ